MTRILLTLITASLFWSQNTAADLMDRLADPTKPVSSRAASRESDSGALQTTVVSPDRSFAIVGGRTVNVGDRVGHAVVTEIRPYEITLTSSTGVTVMRMMPPLTRTITKTASETPLER